MSSSAIITIRSHHGDSARIEQPIHIYTWYTFTFGRAEVKPHLGIQRDGTRAPNPVLPVPGRVLQAHQLQRERGFPSPQLLQLVGNRLALLTVRTFERRRCVTCDV